MTFDATETRNHEKSMRFDIPMVQPHIIDDDNDSALSAEMSHNSKIPINSY